jgi:hypothetical protein
MEGKTNRTELGRKLRYVCILQCVVLSIKTKLVLTTKTIVLLQNIVSISDKNERRGRCKKRDNQGVKEEKSGREGGIRKIRKRGEKQENTESARGSAKITV